MADAEKQPEPTEAAIEESCGTCRFGTLSIGPTGTGPGGSTSAAVVCRRFPPHLFLPDRWQYPIMSPENWCGEYDNGPRVQQQP